MAALGLAADRLGFLDLPDGRAPWRGRRFRDAAERIADIGRSFSAGIICTTWTHDPHRDHVAAYRLGASAARMLGTRLLCYPVWGWTLGEQNRLPATPIQGMRLDISNSVAKKKQAISCYRSQLTNLIEDDPSGFRLAPEFLALFERPFEVFLEERTTG
jgi:LmbE family N-acetylglucosaminyl deacetylase